MATVKQPSVYGVLETNHVVAVKTGASKTQFPLDATNFATINAENGMLLVVDEFSETVKLPTAITNYVMLHNSVEKDYEDKGRKYFSVKQADDFYPRLTKLTKGDTFETNTFQYSDVTYANYAAIVAAINSTTVYGIPSTAGYIQLVATLGGTEVVTLKAVKGVTLPNGESGLKFVVVSA